MKITDILSEASIKINMSAENKKDLIEQMIFLAEKSGKIEDREEALRETLAREEIMSTGVGKGVALPHAKLSSLDSCVSSLAILNEPIDYDAIDGEPVKIAFLLLGSENNVGAHLKMLSKISRFVNNDSYRERLLSCKKAREILNLFNEYEENEN